MKDHGRIVWHFGRNYFWSVGDNGRLSLVSVARINDAVAEIREALPKVVEALGGLDGEQQV